MTATIEQFIKLVVDTQDELHSIVAEKAKNQTSIIENNLDTFERDFFATLSFNHKKYYSRVALYLIWERMNSMVEIPFDNTFDKPSIKNPSQEFTQLGDFQILTDINKFIKEKSDSQNGFCHQIILKYSLLPSICQSFFEPAIFNNFCDYLQLVYQQTNQFPYDFTKCLFISPLFTSFLHQTIEPIISEYSNSGDIPDELIYYIRELIKTSMLRNLKLIPEYLIKLFTKFSEKKREILEHAFVLPMIEHPDIYLVSNSMIDIFGPCQAFKKKQMTLLFNDDFINFLNEKVFDSKSFEYFAKTFLPGETSQEILQRINSSRLLDSIDLLVLQNTSNPESQVSLFSFLVRSQSGDCSRAKPSYFFYKVSILDFNVGPSTFYLQTLNNATSSDCYPLLRKLIKDAPALPRNITPPNGQFTEKYFKSFVLDYLVNIPDPIVAMNQAMTFERMEFFKFRIDNGLRALQNRFKAMIDQHTESDEAAKQCHNLIKQCDHLNLLGRVSYFYNQTVFSAFLFRQFLKRIQSTVMIQTNIKMIYQTPLRINHYFWSIYQQFCNNELTTKYMGNYEPFIFLYHYYYQNVTFSSFLAHRPELQRYDTYVQTQIAENFASLCKQLDKKFGQLSKQEIVQKELENHWLYQAFKRDGDPLTKALAVIGNMFDIAIALGVDSDSYSFFFLYIMILLNPPHLYSTIVYINEFVLYEIASRFAYPNVSSTTIYPDFPFSELLKGFRFFYDSFNVSLLPYLNLSYIEKPLPRFTFNFLLVLYNPYDGFCDQLRNAIVLDDYTTTCGNTNEDTFVISFRSKYVDFYPVDLIVKKNYSLTNDERYSAKFAIDFPTINLFQKFKLKKGFQLYLTLGRNNQDQMNNCISRIQGAIIEYRKPQYQ